MARRYNLHIPAVMSTQLIFCYAINFDKAIVTQDTCELKLFNFPLVYFKFGFEVVIYSSNIQLLFVDAKISYLSIIGSF